MQLMDKREVAAMLRVSGRTVDRLRKAGRLKAVRVGARVRFSPSAVEAFLKAELDRSSSYRRLRPGEAPDLSGALEVLTDSPDAPPAPLCHHARYSCDNSRCAAQEVTVSTRRPIDPTPPMTCPDCRRKLRLVSHVEAELLVPAKRPKSALRANAV